MHTSFRSENSKPLFFMGIRRGIAAGCLFCSLESTRRKIMMASFKDGSTQDVSSKNG